MLVRKKTEVEKEGGDPPTEQERSRANQKGRRVQEASEHISSDQPRHRENEIRSRFAPEGRQRIQSGPPYGPKAGRLCFTEKQKRKVHRKEK
jgi:hypothetical protein